MHNLKYKLKNQEQNELFIKLAKAITTLHSSQEAANFLRDLLSEVEVLMLARRLQIAELLIEGLTYDQIRSRLKAGPGTIARVQTWLELYGDGYREVIKRCASRNKSDDELAKPYSQLKKKYPMYFWPELLLKEIIKSAKKREKQRLLKVVEQLRTKTHLTSELNKLLTQ